MKTKKEQGKILGNQGKFREFHGIKSGKPEMLICLKVGIFQHNTLQDEYSLLTGLQIVL